MRDTKFQKKAYAFKINGKRKRLKCQSGGAFTAFAEVLINKGWVVYGVIYEKPYAVYARIDNKNDLKKLAGSKYVQAKMNCMRNIVKDISEGKNVLFSGNPCYCAAVQSYCDARKVNREKLLTIEFLCHGVPSPELFRMYLEYAENTTGFESTDFNFRDKNIDGWGGYYSTLKNDSSMRKVSENWLDIYNAERYLRPSCYNCKFTTYERGADVTISDFGGISKIQKGFGDNKGISMILFNNERGIGFIPEIGQMGEMIESIFSAIDQQPLNRPVKYQDDEVKIDWENRSFEENALNIIKHYDKKYISFWNGVPLTLNIKFLKHYFTFKIKSSSLLAALRKV